MALKPFYVIDGKRWISVGRASELLGTNGAGVKKLMGDGSLDWCQLRPNSTTLLVDEQTILLLCQDRKTELKAAANRAKRNLPTARQRGTSQLDVPPESAMRSSDVFTRTWDPSPGPEALARARRKEP